MTPDIDVVISEAVAGSERALGRLLKMVERDETTARNIVSKIERPKGVFRIGVTGSPGSGKSTLIDRLIGVIRSDGLTVGVICVDPSSPLTGGAVLGDRIRMERHYSDEGVFIRSMASRGERGGVARAVRAAAELLGACGKDVVIVETVGVGQEAIEVTKLVDVTVLVLEPGSCDGMQLMKAGILEVADVVVVNKSDLGHGGSAEAIREILSAGRRERRQPVVETEAINDVGVDALWREVKAVDDERRRS